MTMPLLRAIDELTRLNAEATMMSDVQRDGPVHDLWRASVDAVMANSLPANSKTLQEFRNLSYTIGVWTGTPGEAEQDRKYFASQVRRANALVEAAMFELRLIAPEDQDDDRPDDDRSDTPVASPGTIFVVHGHDDSAKYQLARLLERTTPLDAVILHEQTNRGATVIEKFERHAEEAAFAVILLTADDEGRAKRDSSASLNARARQNVVFEMGFFVGLLHRQRVVVLHGDGVELPSDLAGLIYIPLDSAGAWRLELLKEIEGVGIEVDRTKIP